VQENCKVSGAPVTMRKLGEATDAAVLKITAKNPGITVSEIAQILDWSNGKVDGSINRLLQNSKVKVKHQLQRGMLLKKVYLPSFSAKPSNIIEIPNELLDCSSWTKHAYVYALSRSTLGIASEENEEWKTKALLAESASVKKVEGGAIVTLPEQLAGFYQLDNSETTLSAVANIVLVSIETVLPINLTPVHPEKKNNSP
jgi:hypothetical protein